MELKKVVKKDKDNRYILIRTRGLIFDNHFFRTVYIFHAKINNRIIRELDDAISKACCHNREYDSARSVFLEVDSKLRPLIKVMREISDYVITGYEHSNRRGIILYRILYEPNVIDLISNACETEGRILDIMNDRES